MDYEELGRAPVKPDAPAGSDVRSEDDFDDLQAEIGKLADPAATSPTDWQKVAELSARLLHDKGKDLQVACYLAIALTEISGLEGFETGIKVLRDLIQNFWEDMFPPPNRLRRRRNALSWYIEKAAPILQKMQSTPLSAELISTVSQAIDDLNRSLADKDPEAPLLTPLLRDVEAMQVEEQQSEVTPAATPDQSPQSAEPAGQDTTRAGQDAAAVRAPASLPAQESGELPGSSEEAARAVESELTRLGQLAGILLRVDPANPQGYRLNRIAAWSTVDEAPPTDGTKTRLPPPPRQVMDQLAQITSAANPEAVLEFVEARLNDFIYWLDLNRLASSALGRMGTSYALARKTVVEETAHFVRRIPRIVSLTFSDGTPFADAATRDWLSSSGATPTAVSHVAQVEEDSDEISSSCGQANTLAEQGQLVDAVNLLQKTLQGASSAHSRFKVQLKLGELVLANANPPDGWPFLASILETVERHNLETWDPTLAVRALLLIYRGLGETGTPDERPDRNHILRRIAALDYSQALRLVGG